MAFPDVKPRTTAERGAIILAVYPSTDHALQIELQRSSTASTWRPVQFFGGRDVPQKAIEYVDELPLDGITRTYRARNSSGLWWSAGPWTATVSGKPFAFDGDIPLDGEAFRRVNTLFSDNGVLLGVVGQKDGTLALPFMTGFLSGAANGGSVSTGTWVDGGAVSFAKAFSNPPVVKLFPEQGAVTYQPGAAAWTSSASFASTGPQSVELTAINITTTGFVPRARLVQRSGGLTARTANFSTTNSLGVGQASSATPANAPSYNDQYTAHYRVDMSRVSLGTPITVTAVVSVGANTTGGYVEYGTKTYAQTLYTTASTASWSHETQTLTVSGAVSTDKMRVRFKSLSVSPGTTGDVDVTVHAFDGAGDPSAGLTYYTQASAIYAPMCATTNDTISWAAWSPGAST